MKRRVIIQTTHNEIITFICSDQMEKLFFSYVGLYSSLEKLFCPKQYDNTNSSFNTRNAGLCDCVAETRLPFLLNEITSFSLCARTQNLTSIYSVPQLSRKLVPLIQRYYNGTEPHPPLTQRPQIHHFSNSIQIIRRLKKLENSNSVACQVGYRGLR
jgi:hypothetical protein